MASRIRKLVRCQRGNSFIIVTGVMPLLVGAGAIGVDVAQWALAKRHLQRMADTGAIAGANAVLQGNAAKPAVDRSLDHNNQITLDSPATTENAPTVGAYAGDATAVRVVVLATPQAPFVSLFRVTPETITAEATAKALPDPRFCMVALEDGTTPGFDFSGSSDVEADCGLMTNSRAKPTTVEFGGNAARVTATEVGAVGPLKTGSNWTTGTKLLPYQAKLQDPYSYAPEASTYASSCTSATAVNVEGNQWNNKTFPTSGSSPWCFSSLSFKTKVSIQPGVYVIKGGLLEFAGGAQVSSTGPVTFILTGDNASSIARLSITSTAIVNLTAPTTGSLKDLLIYQDRRARHLSSENTITGNASSSFNGGIYFPTSNLNFTGNSTSTGLCVRFVAQRITMTGSSLVKLSCTGSSRDSLFGRTVRLVA